ncbi:uncharacterized protein LTR77_009990 [Saxophila tyrrhenica]|uniref:RRM domain-containing protein n=1 Tax=Saxophila tyrrhenica TaxID=1690608 RepID=A0AAV9P0C7_9PEZI|nr:hypothetical protein LTR77_009990 [Saxophila tyrrhenica]
MSQEESLSRKERKAQRDAERKKTGKKRKHEDVEEPKANGDELQADFIPLAVGADGLGGGKDKSKAKEKKSSKKRKHDEPEKLETVKTKDRELGDDFIPLGVDADELGSKEKKSSKKSSKKRKAQDASEDQGDTADRVPDTITPKQKKRKKQTTTDGENGGASTNDDDSKSKHRFVCFIGNLPYDTTDASLQAHFKKLSPFTLRHRTDPNSKRSKGFAFLEFENYDRMKTCLKLYHHSMFDPATAQQADGEIEVAEEEPKAKKGKTKGARRINVELTAGGGGSKDVRKEKIKAKNVRLDEQRQRRAEAERIERLKEEAKKGGGGKDEGKRASGGKGGEKKRVEGPKEGGGGDVGVGAAAMHPSRLARMKA